MSDDEALLDELDADVDLQNLREQRLRELRQQAQAQERRQDLGLYGQYTELKDEKTLVATMAKASRVVLHFFHRDFARCKTMDRHLHALASMQDNDDCLFLSAEVSNVPFMVAKFEVQVLPCVVGFVDGTSKMKIVGFEGLPGGDNFSTKALQNLMIQCEVLQSPAVKAMSRRAKAEAEDEDDGEEYGRSQRRGIRRATRQTNDGSDSD